MSWHIAQGETTRDTLKALGSQAGLDQFYGGRLFRCYSCLVSTVLGVSPLSSLRISCHSCWGQSISKYLRACCLVYIPSYLTSTMGWSHELLPIAIRWPLFIFSQEPCLMQNNQKPFLVNIRQKTLRQSRTTRRHATVLISPNKTSREITGKQLTKLITRREQKSQTKFKFFRVENKPEESPIESDIQIEIQNLEVYKRSRGLNLGDLARVIEERNSKFERELIEHHFSEYKQLVRKSFKCCLSEPERERLFQTIKQLGLEVQIDNLIEQPAVLSSLMEAVRMPGARVQPREDYVSTVCKLVEGQGIVSTFILEKFIAVFKVGLQHRQLDEAMGIMSRIPYFKSYSNSMMKLVIVSGKVVRLARGQTCALPSATLQTLVVRGSVRLISVGKARAEQELVRKFSDWEIVTFESFVNNQDQLSNMRQVRGAYRQQSFYVRRHLEAEQETVLLMFEKEQAAKTEQSQVEAVRERVKMLSRQPFLFSLEAKMVEQLASVLTIEDYEEGQIIVKEGWKPDRFLIVLTGRCRVVNYLQLRVTPPTPKQRAFCTSLSNFCTHSRQRSSQPRLASYELMSFELRDGDIILGRGLLNEYLRLNNLEGREIKPAGLTVIADTRTQVCALSQQQYIFLPQQLQQILGKKIALMDEIDLVVTPAYSNSLKAWKRLKQDVVSLL